MLNACIAPMLAVLDGALALQRSGVHVLASYLPESDTYAAVQYALRLWCGAHMAEIEIRDEPHGQMQYVKVDGLAIASIHVPAVETVVVDMPLERAHA